jgi:hypothetical protein
MMEKSKIYIWFEPTDFLHYSGWLNVRAVAEDGGYLASHVSSNEWWAKKDIGLTSDSKHEIYRSRYPNGYELILVDKAPENYRQINTDASVQNIDPEM